MSETQQETRPSALDVMTAGIFDYAGMFPPASESFESALSLSAQFPTTLIRPFMVGTDAVVEINYLSQLTAEALQTAGFDSSRMFRVSVLGSPLKDRNEALSEERLAELTAIQSFNESGTASGPSRKVVGYEFRLDKSIQEDAGFLSIALRNIKSFLIDAPVLIAIEPDLSVESWERTLQIVTTVLSDLNEHSRGPRLALKIRGSGPTAITPDKLAKVLDIVCDLELDFKATAGLHHPIIEAEKYKNQLGFVNLATALFLRRAAGANEFPTHVVMECLLSQSAADFTFSAESLQWKNYVLSVDELQEMKDLAHFSIGSCSLHEPDADLARLFP